MADIAYDTWELVKYYYQDNAENCLPVEISKKLDGTLRARNIATIAALPWQHASQASEARVLLQLSSFFSKNSIFTNSTVTRAAALQKFADAEKLCSETNKRLAVDSFLWQKGCYNIFHREIEVMKELIKRVLGSHEKFMSRIHMYSRVSGGASIDLVRSSSHPTNKIARGLSGTYNALKLMCEQLPESLRVNFVKRCKVLNTNEIVFVPKNFKTDRAIAIEGTYSSIAQLSYGSYITDRLRLFGQDLSDQSRNQRAAKIGSIDGSLATIDLQSASDTLSTSVVKLLLPREWFEALDGIRSCFGVVRGEAQRILYAKFSSMGNGFTFPLETLIFFAACKAVGSTMCEVYGDDIIIESNLSDRLTNLLSYLGFIVNSDKSFSSGPIRESCGEFYFNGESITPFFLRDSFTRSYQQICLTINSLVPRIKPFGFLMGYFIKVIRERKLIFTPLNENKLDGIHFPVELLVKHNYVKPITRIYEYELQPPHCASCSNKCVFNQKTVSSFVGYSYRGYREIQTTKRIRPYRSYIFWLFGHPYEDVFEEDRDRTYHDDRFAFYRRWFVSRDRPPVPRDVLPLGTKSALVDMRLHESAVFSSSTINHIILFTLLH